MEADAVVAHAKCQSSIFADKRYIDLACAGMTNNVSQRLLSDSKQAYRPIQMQLRMDCAKVEIYSYRLLAGQTVALGAQCFNDAEILND
jgi:hypothetical protein